jgi:transcriptional regulator with GAF, ATPase, and Fis domain
VDLLLTVWRAACRRAEIGDSLDDIAGAVAARLPADVLMVRRFDVERSQVETVAAGACQAAMAVPAQTRTPCPPHLFGSVLAWAREGRVVRGPVPAGEGVLAALAPPAWRGECVAGPLTGDRDPVGALVALAASAGKFDADSERLLADLLEPVGVALANHWRLQELARLREALEADKQALLTRLERQDVSDTIVGTGTGLRQVMQRVEQVAPTEAPVLIIGETGTGKEVVARAIHARSRRAAGPIVRVNCGAIPPGLIDSELFGHERGSFTGAVATRHGWFERADGGTLFLDEVGELPPEAQVRLLRILQDGTFERVGGQRVLTVDVRIVAATHRDLQDMVARRGFREDLWYRIGVFPIHLPPLRDRIEDIPMLAAHFGRRAGHRLRGKTLVPSPSDVELLITYSWPGNVRELAAVIERAAILGGGMELKVAAALGLPEGPAASSEGIAVTSAAPERRTLQTLDAAMSAHVEAALARAGGRVEGPGGAAGLLRVNPHTLRARMRRLGVDWTPYRAQAPGTALPTPTAVPITWDAAMRHQIELALEATSGRIEGPHGAAALLGINPHTLRARMRKLGVDWQRFRRESAPVSASYLA